MAWLNTDALIAGETLAVRVKTIGGRPVRLESLSLVMIGAPVEIEGEAFTVAKVKPLHERFTVHLKPAPAPKKSKVKSNGK
ncbi:MAG: hypothetical protein C0605_07980 [Hyphomicrobiales bacterium]|nr:MAG: hypothetical protein C0605_07980 [Hyphomicrobiales bacterium]